MRIPIITTIVNKTKCLIVNFLAPEKNSTNPALFFWKTCLVKKIIPEKKKERMKKVIIEYTPTEIVFENVDSNVLLTFDDKNESIERDNQIAAPEINITGLRNNFFAYNLNSFFWAPILKKKKIRKNSGDC